MPTESVHWAVTSDAVKVYREDLKAAKALDAGIDRLAASLDNGSKASKRLSASILKAGEALKQERRIAEATVKITKEWGVSTATAAKVARRFRGEVDALSPALKREAKALDLAQKETRQLAAAQRKAAAGMSSGSSIASGLTKNLVALAAGFAGVQLAARGISESVRTFAGLEDQLLGTQAVTNATAEEMARLTAQAKELGATTPRTATEIAGLQQELARAGFTVEETLQSTGGLIAFASAGQLELAEATGFAATILRAFDKDVSQLGLVTDVLAVSASGAKTDIGQLASAFEFAAAPAAAVGASLEETAAAIAVVQERGVQGTKAGRGLLGIFRELSVETARGTAVLEKAGLTYDDVNVSVRGLLPVIQTLADTVGDDFTDAVQLVGSEAAPAFLNLIRGVEKFGDLTEENMLRAAGRTQEMAEVMESGLGGAGRRLRSAIEGVAIAFGEGLAPALEDAGDGLAQFLADNREAIKSLGELAGFALRVAGAFAEIAAEIVSVGTATSLVRDLESDIAAIVDESATARDRIIEWQDAIESLDPAQIESALAAAEKEAADVEAQLAALRAEAEKFPEGSQGYLVVAERMRPLEERAQAAEVFVRKLNVALEAAGGAAAAAASPAAQLTERLGTLRARIETLGDAQKIRAEAEAQANRELEASLSRIEKSRQALLGLEAQALDTGEAFVGIGALGLPFIVDTVGDLARREELPSAEGIEIEVDLDVDPSNAEAAIADMRDKAIKAAEEAQAATEKRMTEAWLDVADVAFSVADAIGGSFGDMLGGLVGGVLGVRDAFKGLQGTSGLQALTGGFGLGQQVSGVAGALGLQQGAGGAISGLFGAAGTALGGPIGGVIGGVVGSLVESLGFLKKGGDTAISGFEVAAGRLVAVGGKLEGDLGPGIEAFSGAITKSINAILASLGAFFGPGGLADIDVKIRQEGDETFFQVRRFGETFAKFTDEAQAVTAAIQTILSESDIQGLSENVAAAIRNTTAQTFDQLAADIGRAQLVDERLMTEGERFLAARTRLLREEINALSDLGVSMNDVLEGLRRQEEALARQAELRALSIAGVDTSLELALAELDILAEQAAQAEALNAAYQEAADGATAASQAEATLGQERAEAFGDLDEFRGVLPGVGRGFRDLEESAMAAAQASEVAVGEIEGVDAALVEMAREATVARGLGNFIAKIAQLTGDSELAAQAAELQHQAMILTLRLEFERLKALGLINDELAATIETTLQQAEELGAAFDDAPAGGRRGAGAGRRQRREAAAASFREAVADIEAQLSGTRPELLAMADATEKLREQAREGKIGAQELADGLSALAELQRRELADLGQQGLANLGGVAAQVQTEAAEAAAEIGFLLGNLDLLGLTVRDVRVAVRQGLAPALLSIAESEARRVGNLEAAERIAERRAVFERQAERLRFEAMVATLELAGALSPALADVVAEARGFFDLPDAVAGTVEEAEKAAAELSKGTLTSFFSIAESEAQQAVERTLEGSQERIEAEAHLADVQQQRATLERNLERLRFEALIAELELAGRLTPELRALADTTLDLFDSAAVGVDGLSAAVDDFGEAAQQAVIIMGGMNVPGTLDFDELETLADIIDELNSANMTPLESAVARFEETMDRIALATGTAAERAEAIALAEAELARERAKIFEDQISGLRALDAEVTEAILMRQAPRSQVIAARGAFENALANLDLGDPASIDAFNAAATQWRAVVANYDQSLQAFGGSGAALVSTVDQIIAEALAQILPPAPPGVDPGTLPGTLPPPPIPGGGSTLPPPAPSPAATFDSSSIVAAVNSLQVAVADIGTRVDNQTLAMTTWQSFVTPTVADVGAASRAIVLEFPT
jgi:TP901 family phage tail tape measure protein